MSKTYVGTKKHRGVMLLKRLKLGPFTDLDPRARVIYEAWVQTWILPEVVELLPELKKLAQNNELESEVKGGGRE